MKREKNLIIYKGHQITRESHYLNAYIHYEYTVTGPLFDEPFKTYKLQKAKNEISERNKFKVLIHESNIK